MTKACGEGGNDWRVAFAAKMTSHLPSAYPGGPSFSPGSDVYFSCGGEAKGIGAINFIAPSPVALAMNVSLGAADNAIVKKKSFTFVDAPSPDGTLKHLSSSITSLFDYFEQCMICVIFAYQALEAFSNDAVMRHPSDSISVPDKKGRVKTLTKREAERHLSTAIKLGDLAPGICRVKPIKGTSLWQDFLQLEAVRDKVVHMKNQYVGGKAHVESSRILVPLIADDPTTWPRTSMNILSHFVANTEYAWFKALNARIGRA